MEEGVLQRTILEYLGTHHTLSLATAEGSLPHAAAVFYVNIGFAIYFLSSPGSRHGMHLSKNPRVSATVNEDYSAWREIKGIQMEGRVTPVGGIVENGRLAYEFMKKFPDVSYFFSDPRRLGEAICRKIEGVSFYKLEPERIFFINNEEGFGHRDELLLGQPTAKEASLDQ